MPTTAATAVGAMILAYQGLAGQITPLPFMWFDELPDDQANNLPNVGLEQLGEKTHYESREGGKLRVTHRVARLKLHVLNVGFEATDVLAQRVRDLLMPESASVTGADETTLVEMDYKLGSAKYRNKDLKAVFAAVTEYELTYSKV